MKKVAIKVKETDLAENRFLNLTKFRRKIEIFCRGLQKKMSWLFSKA